MDEINNKLVYYAQTYHVKSLIIGGGVSANLLLRKKLKSMNIPVYFPELKYTGDNAAMIANYCYLLLKNKKFKNLKN